MRPIALSAASLVLLGGASIALADSPHFTTASAAFSGSTQNLSVSFKEAGLGASVNVDYVASGSAAATWGCINGGGTNPSAANKRTITSPVSAPGTFSSGKNGSVTASITLPAPPPPAPTDFSCPSGQTLRQLDITWTGVSILDKTNNVTQAISGTFAKTLLTTKK